MRDVLMIKIKLAIRKKSLECVEKTMNVFSYTRLRRVIKQTAADPAITP